MFSAQHKIHKDHCSDLSELDDQVAQALKDLYIKSAAQVDVFGGRKAVVINVSYILRKAYRKIHVRLSCELKKKFSGKVGQLFLIMFQVWFNSSELEVKGKEETKYALQCNLFSTLSWLMFFQFPSFSSFKFNFRS